MLSAVEEAICAEVEDYLLFDYLFKGFRYVVRQCHRSVDGRVALVSSLENWGDVRQVDIIWHDTSVQRHAPDEAKGGS